MSSLKNQSVRIAADIAAKTSRHVAFVGPVQVEKGTMQRGCGMITERAGEPVGTWLPFVGDGITIERATTIRGALVRAVSKKFGEVQTFENAVEMQRAAHARWQHELTKKWLVGTEAAAARGEAGIVTLAVESGII